MENLNMKKLEQATYEHTKAYCNWVQWGRREADDDLNQSSIDVIRAFKAVYPNAMGFKSNVGLVPITEPIYNFAMEYVFDGNADIIKRIEEADNSIDKLMVLDEYGDATERLGAFLLAWS